MNKKYLQYCINQLRLAQKREQAIGGGGLARED